VTTIGDNKDNKDEQRRDNEGREYAPEPKGSEDFRSRDGFLQRAQPAELRETTRSTMLHRLYLSPSKKLRGARRSVVEIPNFFVPRC